MRRYIIIVPLMVSIMCGAFWLYHAALSNPTYQGLPTVPCIDTTRPVMQNYSLHIAISLYGTAYPLDTNIGHDYGNCLHAMYTNTEQGTVYIRANDTQQYTLGEFFDVWHKTFTNTQIMQYQSDATHHIHIFVNGREVTTGRMTPLNPQDSIEVSYQ